MRKITADIIFPVASKPITNKVMLVSDDGQIIGFKDLHEFSDGELEKYEGALVPGFINTHCHLELSHLKNKFPEKTGLPEFLKLVTKQRTATEEEKNTAMQLADEEMFKEGIVAVADISNSTDSFLIKSKKNIYYHTFAELLSLNPFKAYQAMQSGEKLLNAARGYGLHASLAPHAPYTLSNELMKMISAHCYEHGKPTSLHLLESNDENEFFLQGSGKFRELYRELNYSLDFFQPSKKTSLETILPSIHKKIKTLFVHNTIATTWDADWAEDMHENLFWCFCPNANMYIEDRLPDIPMLMEHVQYLTIGTDSLASNHRLSILSELQLIQNKFPEIQTEDLLRWATLYGAKFLGIDEKFGSFEPGKYPGINLLKNIDLQNYSLQGASVQKII